MTWVKTHKYRCKECGKTRYTRKEEIANERICKKCKPEPIPEGQLSIFDVIEDEMQTRQEPVEQDIDILVWDLETTGFVAPEAKILEIGAYIIRGDEVEHKHWVLNNNVEIPEKITEITGITKEIIDAEGRDPSECLLEFLPLFKRCKVNVTHNGVKFDIPFLVESARSVLAFTDEQATATARLIRNSAFDTAVHYKAEKMGITKADGERFIEFANRVMEIRAYGIKFNLSLCCDELGIDRTNITAHRALGDVAMTHEVYKKLTATTVEVAVVETTVEEPKSADLEGWSVDR